MREDDPPGVGDRAEPWMPAPSIALSTDFWLIWLEVAIEHARAARDARTAVMNVPPNDRHSRLAEALKNEIQAALVTMTSSAFAVDAWYGTVKRMIDPLPQLSEDARRSAWVLETLKVGFRLGRAASAWGKPMKLLFQVRDPAVHHRSMIGPPNQHPSGRSLVAAENVVYTAEASVSAMNFAIEVVSTCLKSPRPEMPELVAWCEARPHVVGMLRDKRQEELGDAAPD